MKHLVTSIYLVLLNVLAIAQTPGEIVINKVFPSGDQVELKNIGGTAIDISTYNLCDTPVYVRLSSTNIVCGGDLILDPNEVLVVLWNNFTMNENEGELALYLPGPFSDPNNMLDYVEWGFSGHSRTSVAVTANLWTAGDFVPAFTMGNAILYDGSGSTSSDWNEGMFIPCGGGGTNTCISQRQEDANPLTPGLYEAEISINSAGSVSAGNVDFSAGEYIVLEPNFGVTLGNEFHAFILGCQN